VNFLRRLALQGTKNLTARVSMWLKSSASLTCFRACFLLGRAKDLSAARYINKEDGSQGSEMADTGLESRAVTGFGISNVATSGSATERQVWFLPINSHVHVPRTAEYVKTTSRVYFFLSSLFLISLSFSVFLFNSFVTYSKEITKKTDP